MLPVAHITSNDRYEVTKVRSLTGMGLFNHDFLLIGLAYDYSQL